MSNLAEVQPGWFAVVNTGTPWVTDQIRWAEGIASRAWQLHHHPISTILHGGKITPSRWDHACIASRWDGGRLMVVEARPGGAVEVEWPYEGRDHHWSEHEVTTSEKAGEAARRYIGTGYSYLDYLALAARALGADEQEAALDAIISTGHHMICSQLVDQAEYDAGVHLFSDGRLPGDVMPMDLGVLLGHP